MIDDRVIMIIFSLVSIVIIGLNAVVGQNNEIAENSLRLVGGSTRYEGRVEIYHEGDWGSICDIHLWDDEGNVICRELGYRGVDEVFSDAYFGEGPGTIWLGGFHCTGYESELLECYGYLDWGFPNCGHSQDIGVRCLAAGFMKGDVRLIGGAGINEGFVEIHHWYEWVASSYAHFGYNEALVVCNQLGFSDGVVEYYSKDAPFDISEEYPDDIKAWTDTVGCDGSESRLTDCNILFNIYSSYSYQHADQLNGVVCNFDESSTYNGKIRLVDGDDATHGRLEIYLENQWGTICNDDFSYYEAFVVCRSLGFQDVEDYGEEDVPPGSGNVYLDDLDCGGSESSILCCDVRQLHNFNCEHSGDVVVRCTSPSDPADNVQVGHIAGIAVGAIVGIFLLVLCCVKMCKKSSVSSGHTSTRNPANQITPHQLATDVRGAGQTPPSYNHHSSKYSNPQGSHQPSQPIFDPASSHITQPYTASYPTPPPQGMHPLVAHDPGNGGGYSPGYSYTPALGEPPGFSSPGSPGIQGTTAVHHALLTHHDTSIHYPPVPHLAQPAAVPQVYTITQLGNQPYVRHRCILL